jgi:hypothetical protein
MLDTDAETGFFEENTQLVALDPVKNPLSLLGVDKSWNIYA